MKQLGTRHARSPRRSSRQPATAGTSMNFAALQTDDGQASSGIDDIGIWLVVLQCGHCRNPAPWYLSVLEPCE